MKCKNFILFTFFLIESECEMKLRAYYQYVQTEIEQLYQAQKSWVYSKLFWLEC